MSLLLIIDLALLIYKYEDWRNGEEDCLSRFEALTLHRRRLQQAGGKIAMSYDLASFIYEFFPWNEQFSAVPELRDLRLFVLQDLQRAEYIDIQTFGEINLEPEGIVCQSVEAPKAIDAWMELLCDRAEISPPIATWNSPLLSEHKVNQILALVENIESEVESRYPLPLVWDEDSWAALLATQDPWPDLQKCVALYFQTNPDLKNYPGVREQAIPFDCTPGFWKSVNRYCKEERLRRALIQAVTKKVYGILDASLGDESIGKIRRFRVTDFWRIHYYYREDKLLLDEFGPHDIGGIR